jgi:biotin-(acetyl-CoA carboxylase) ligase
MPLLADSPLAHARFAGAGSLPAGVADPLKGKFFPDAPATASPWRDEPELGSWLLVQERARASQFVAMQQLLAAGEQLPDRLVAVALAGDRFVGQRGRSWTALPGNLHVSAHYRIDRPATALQVPLALWPAVAAARAIERMSAGAVRPGTKWINDLLVAGRKIAGVLVHTSVRGGEIGSVLLGIGVNVAQAPALPAGARQAPAGALARLAPAFAAPDAWADLLRYLLAELEATRAILLGDTPQQLFAAYRERASFLGRSVCIWPVEGDDAAPIAHGQVLELLPDLSLVLSGVPAPIRHGRMTLDPQAQDDLLWKAP